MTMNAGEAAQAAEILAHPLGDVILIPIEQIKPYANNPRKIPAKAVEMVAASIKEFGWQQHVVVDQDMVLIIGHVRTQAAKSLGLTEVPGIVETRLTPIQTRALRIADNRTRDYSTWDFPKLMPEMDGLDEDFSAVLDLADWKEIIAGFEDSQAEAMLELDDDTEQIITDSYTLVCTFETKEDADLAAPQILNLQGAVNVRYSGPK